MDSKSILIGIVIGILVGGVLGYTTVQLLEEERERTYTPESEPPARARTYVGSIKSNKYHLPSCYWAKQIKKENEIWFTSKSDAVSHGYVPCKVCKP